MTGDGHRTCELAQSALLDLLTDPPEELEHAGQHLAVDVSRRYLRSPSRSTWLDRADGSAFQVDEERSRVREALDRLGPGQRAALILGTFGGLSESQLQDALGLESLNDLRELHQRASARVALAAGRAADAPLIDLLNRLLVEAPNPDLWPELEGPVQHSWAARRRTERLLTAGIVVGLILVIAGGAIWLTGLRPGGDGDGAASGAISQPEQEPDAAALASPTVAFASFAAAPTLTPQAETLVAVPDLQLMHVVERASNGQDAIEIYDPATNTSSPFMPVGGSARISPDGAWIVAQRAMPGSPATSLLAGGSLEQSVSWELSLPSPSALAIGNERVYVLNRETPEAYQIQVVDVRTGELVETWAVSAESAAPLSIRSARLTLSPDGERLTLLTTRIDLEADRWTRTLTIYQSGTGEVLDVIIREDRRDDASTSFSVRSARQLAGENVLYSLLEDEWRSVVRLQFLDLDSGEITGFELPLQARSAVAADRRSEDELHAVPSNTGAILYVIQSRQRQVAVIDMRSRSLIGTFPLIAGESDRSLFESNLNHVSYLEGRLSPDGSLLYFAVNRERNRALSNNRIQSPVWVIDTTTWQVTDYWMVAGMPRSMSMSGDGSRVYVQSARNDGSLLLTVIETESGTVADVWETLPSPEWAGIQRMVSVTDLYHSQLGLRPRAGSIIPRDNPALSVLPGVLVKAEGAVAGAESVVTARIVHPVSGELATADATLRFDPNATVVLDLTNRDGQYILVLPPAEPGVYRGRTRLNQAGTWDARVTVLNPDGTSWNVTQRAAIEVTDGLMAEDGGAYRFLVRPANPVNRRTITLRVWMVESQSGQRLPEEIEFLDQITDDARIVLTHPGGERVEEPLTRLDHASFLGWVRFSEPGEWSTEITLTLASGERISIDAGPVTIHDLADPYRRSSPGGDGASTSSGTRMSNPASQ